MYQDKQSLLYMFYTLYSTMSVSLEASGSCTGLPNSASSRVRRLRTHLLGH